MMNKQLKSKWVKALRSGKYRQGVGSLKYRDALAHRTKYCCLGVLQELMPEKLQSSGEQTYLGEDQLKLAGLTHKNQDKLANLNDIDRLSFPEIADYIEQKL